METRLDPRSGKSLKEWQPQCSFRNSMDERVPVRLQSTAFTALQKSDMTEDEHFPLAFHYITNTIFLFSNVQFSGIKSIHPIGMSFVKYGSRSLTA